MNHQTKRFVKEKYTQYECPEVRSIWHRNRRRYSVWIVRPHKSILQEIQSVQDAFKPWIIPMHSPHITISACGFRSENPKYSDDVCEQTIQDQIEQLKGHNSFHLCLDSISSFLNGPIVQIAPSTELLKMNTCLTQHTKDFRTVPYTPHICLGLYKKAYPTAQMLKKMTHIKPFPYNSWNVESVELAEFEASDPTAQLFTKHIVHLST